MRLTLGSVGTECLRQLGLTVTRKASVELTCPAREPLALRHMCSEPEVGLRGGVPEADSGVKWDCGPEV